MKIYHSEGTIKYYGRSYLDQLRKDETWVDSSIIEEYLKNTYNLSLQQYYNLIVFSDKNHVQLCHCCKRKIVNFINLKDGYNKYCNQLCSTNGKSQTDSKGSMTEVSKAKPISDNEVDKSDDLTEENTPRYLIGVPSRGPHNIHARNYRLKISQLKLLELI